jgi:hypothetical protein
MKNNYKIKIAKKNNINIYMESFGKINDYAILLISGVGETERFRTYIFYKYLSNNKFFIIKYNHRDVGLSSSIDFEKNLYTIYYFAKDSTAILNE